MKEFLSKKSNMFVENNGHIKIIKITLNIISKVLIRTAIYLLLIGAVIEALTSGAINNVIVEATTIIEWCYSFTMIIFGMILAIVGCIIMVLAGNWFIRYKQQYEIQQIIKKQIVMFINIALLRGLVQYLYYMNFEYEIYCNYVLIEILLISGGIINFINSRLILKSINDSIAMDMVIQSNGKYSLQMALNGTTIMTDRVKKFIKGITYYYQTETCTSLNRERILGTKDIVCSIPYFGSGSKPSQLIILIPQSYNKPEAYYHGVLQYLENEGFIMNTIKFGGENLQEVNKANKCLKLIQLRRKAYINERDLFTCFNVARSSID